MKLTKIFVVYRNWDARTVKRRIGTLIRTLDTVAKLEGETLLWKDYGCDCVFMCGTDGDLTAGDRISSRRIPDVVKKWAESFIAMIQFDPDDEGIGCSLEDVGTEMDLANSCCELEISCPEGEYGLRIRCVGEDGSVIDQIVFAPVAGTGDAPFAI